MDASNKTTVLNLQQELFIFFGLLLATSFALPWREDQAPGDYLFSTEANRLLWWFLFLGVCAAPLTVRFPSVRPWAGIFAVLCTNAALIGMGGATGYAGHMARFFSLGMLVLSAQPAVISATNFAMKRLNSQKAEVSSHWGTTLESLHFSAQEFYAKVEKAIHARQWPGVELLRVLHSEAGLLSHQREYLRVVRQRQVFDICASTFGKDYFFTLREAEIKPPVSVATVLIFLIIFFSLFAWIVVGLGLVVGVFCFFMGTVIGFFLLWNSLRMGLTQLDGLLMRWPVIGPIYETFFRRSTTYFQHDTRMVFLKLMDDLLKEQVDEETSAQGIKLLSCFEHRPIFTDFYKIADRPTHAGDKK
jgi:hypothetical protein